MEKILVVEDQPSNRDLLATLLRYKGWTVLLAGDGVEALEITRKERPDLIIADVLMPRMDGYEFVRQVRADPEIQDIKVIFYTASYFEEGPRALAKACGVSLVLAKPSDPEVILAAVEMIMGTAPPVPVPMEESEFDQEHRRLLTDKLSDKVNELENLNAQLEERVHQRTNELAEANSRLTELNRIKDEFLAIVSHDLRTPLSGILLGAQTMAMHGGKMSADKQRQMLEQIAACATEQIAFVNELLTLARQESTKLKLEMLRLSDVASDSASTVAFSATAKEITVKISSGAREAEIPGDRSRLVQLFNNLLSNAIKFTPAGGRIAIHIETRPDEVRAIVSDTGVGIPADKFPKLLEGLPGPRSLGTEGEKGTGLGLVIVRQVVDMHGGSVDVTSKSGVGTTFTLHFPRYPNLPEPY